MSSSVKSSVSLIFPLETEDGWPPVATESLPFQETRDGYVAVLPPLFVKNLSVGDIIEVRLKPGSKKVDSWQHVKKSGRTTVWLLRLRQSSTIGAVLVELRALGCNTAGLDDAGAFSVDVPESVPIETVDAVLAKLDANSVATAFPSMRHQE